MNMIEVKNLTKRFGRQVAVDDISFSVRQGEVVGFLGPNGAGKTTTMRILTGYLPATGGEVRIGHHDVLFHSLEVRRNIGYLPESCPLYLDMRVDEYLRYRARLKGLRGTRRRARIGEVKEQCGLTEVGRRIIGQLSKGYRQRVGLADALLHEPDLLILDEPTIGLDPNQIREIRRLIKGLASKHTILLSTHILTEVEATCQRVIILNKGKLVATDALGSLAEGLSGINRVVAEIRGLRSDVLGACRDLAGVRQISDVVHGAWVRVEIEGDPGIDLRVALFQMAVRQGWLLRELKAASGNLEDVFGELTIGNGAGGAA